MTKDLCFSNSARQKIYDGMEKIAKAVGATLGPRGKLACIETNYGEPVITKDGVSVAEAITLKDNYENLGASLIKSIASKSCDDVGDGTSTSTVLGYALAKEGLKAMEDNVSSIDLKKGIDFAISDAITEIKNGAKMVETTSDIYNVAKVSSNNDETLASLISEAFEKVGNDGLISVADSNNGETYLSFKEGMNIDRGYVSPYFINNDKMECELKDCYVLVTDESINSAQQIVSLLNEVAKTGKPLLIVANDVGGEVLPILIFNNSKGSIQVNAVKSPSFGEYKTAILEDIAILTGATFISDKVGTKTVAQATLGDLGKCDKVVSTKNETLFIGGKGDSTKIQERIDSINNAISTETSETTIEKLKDRLAKLTGGVCILNVYAPTEVQLKELKDRVEDTLSSVRASIKAGVTLGGGVTLLQVGNKISPKVELSADEQIGYDLVKKIMAYPIRLLSINSGLDANNVIKETLQKGIPTGGYNMLTREWDDNLIDTVVDPVLVEVSALENASSIVGLVLNTEVAIVNNKEDDKKETK